MCLPAPAPPPATSCLHHIPVIFSSSENSSGIKMSDDSPMFTAWGKEEEEGWEELGGGRGETRDTNSSITWQLDYVALLGVLWVINLNGIYTTILTTSHNKLYYHGNFLKLIGTSISTLRGHLTTLSLMLVLWVGEKCLHHWPTFTQCSYTNGSIKKIYIIATNYRWQVDSIKGSLKLYNLKPHYQIELKHN